MSDKTLQEQIAEERAALTGLDVGADGDGGATPDQSDDDLLDIQSPAEEPTSAAKKKSIPTIVKVLGGGAVLGLGLLVALQMATPKPQATTQGGGRIGVNVNEAPNFRGTQASDMSTNPEAIALQEQVRKRNAEELLKDPTKSYVTADPFGSTGTGDKPDPNAGNNIKPASENAQIGPPELIEPTAPPQPRHYDGNGNGQEQEDPSLNYARKIWAYSVMAPRPGISAGNVPVTAAAAAGGGMSTAAQAQANANSIPDSDIGAGEIMYAQMTSALNSIVPQTPPRAIIRGGKLNGAVLLGQMETVESRYLVLRFTTLTLGKKTYPVNAIAVNPEMQDAGIMDNVRDRTWTRAALQAGVGFVQAFGAAKLEEGTTTNVSNEGWSSSTTPNRTNKETALIALGGAAQAVKPTVDQEIAKLKDEVTVQPGKELGILFMQPFSLQK